MTLFTIGSPCLLHAVSAFPSTFQAAILGTGAACFGVVSVYIALSTGPYVAYLRWLPKEEGKKIEGIDMVTYTWLLQKRITRVYNPGFLVDSDKPFTTWKLARRFQLPPFVAHIVKPGQEEVVAETFDRCGEVLGRWIVTWGEDGRGYCRGEGNIQRYDVSRMQRIQLTSHTTVEDSSVFMSSCSHDRYGGVLDELVLL